MTSRLHANAPLSLDGRRRLIERCRSRPIAHVAEEMGVFRATASKWVNRHHGQAPGPYGAPRCEEGRTHSRRRWVARTRQRQRGDHSRRRHETRGAKTGYVYLHSAIDGYLRLACTEALSDEKAVTAVAFLGRAKAWFAAHGITRIERVVTDDGSCYRAAAFREAVGSSPHQRITPCTPRHNGKVERYDRILPEEVLYARSWKSEAERAAALGIWNQP
jgi:transposase InsO family protein